jgi:subtilisin-like proprotein convertase family protein
MGQDNPLFQDQWHFGQIGDIQSVWRQYTGEGVSVAVYDDGVEQFHPDLNSNYNASLHFRDGIFLDDGQPNGPSDSHGTAVAGIIAAENNMIGGVGVAYDATITGTTLLTDIFEQGVSTGLEALRYMSTFDVANHSWGYTPDFANYLNLINTTNTAYQEGAAFDYAAENGRAGLGTILVKAAGNNANNPELQNSGIWGHTQGEGHNSLHSIIVVSATSQTGQIADYSSWGSNILIAAPAASVTTDLAGSAGYSSGNYANDFGGTSAATPVVAGVAALMLDANPNLGWRDVQMILATSAAHTGSEFGTSATGFEVADWFSNGATIWNGGGMSYSLSYGYGMVDVHAAVRMAEVWGNIYDNAHVTSNTEVAFGSMVGGTRSILDNSTTEIEINVSDNVIIEHINVTIEGGHSYSADLTLELVAPDGTKFLLFDQDAGSADFEGWVFGVSGAMGMNSFGVWSVLVTDTEWEDTGYIDDVTLMFEGRTVSQNTVHYITNDFNTFAEVEEERRVIQDRDGGSADWLNLVAVTDNVSLSLELGGELAVGDLVWASLSQNDLIENAATGDGDDRIEGNSSANELLGARGSDTLFGGSGNDFLLGGAGSDQLFGQADDDVVYAGHGADRVFGGSGRDSILGAKGADSLKGGSGADTIKAGSGNDMVNGGKGRDLVSLGAGNDKYSDTSQAGINGRDRVKGGTGNDTIHSGAGADTLIGGSGNDQLSGGAGADRFVFRQSDGSDSILDFKVGVDLIRIIAGAEDLSDISFQQLGDNVQVSFASTDVLIHDTTIAVLEDVENFQFV